MNCTLKKSPEKSHTEELMQLSQHIMEAVYVKTEMLRPVDYDNEDGVKHCSMSILYGLQHIGYTIPPQSDAGWIGEVGPGASYADEGSEGPENNFTNRNTTFMTWNLLHFAQMLADQGGIPAHGNQRSLWE